MDKLFYLSSTDLAQVDMGFLHHLTDHYEVHYGVVIPERKGNYSESEIAEYATRNQIKFKAYHFTKRKRDPRIGMDYLKILQDIKRINPAVIYTISFDVPIISLMNLTLDTRKTIVCLHDVKFHSNIPYAFYFKIGRDITMSHFKNFQVFSKNQENIFKTWFPKKTVYEIPLTLSDFGPSENKVTTQVGDKSITKFLFFGHIEPYKGLGNLLNVINTLSKKHSNFELTIAGRCEVWDDLYEPLIENQNVIKKRIGFIKNEEIPQLFSETDYLILPYKDATQSGPLMIAYNYNVPVIASNVDAFTTAIEEDKSGFLFDINEPKSLEKTLEAAILRTENEYNSLLERLKEYVNTNYATENIVKKYIQMFSKVIKEK